jgi:hypothetical protein
MDKLSELTHGAKVVLGAAIAFLIFSFFSWFTVDLGPLGDSGENMWHGVGFLAGLLAIALIVWQAIRLANIELEIGIGPAMATAALALLLVIFTFIRFIDKPGGDLASSVVDRTIWAWLGLVLAIVVAVGAWMNMQATGESIQGMMDRFGSKESSAAPAAPSTPAAPPPAAPAADPASPPAAEPPAAPEAPPPPGDEQSRS